MKNIFHGVFYTDYNEDREGVLLSTHALGELSFSTIAPGGFQECSFNLKINPTVSPDWYRLLLGKHFVLFDWWGDRAFEGRVEDSEVNGEELSIKVYGYYANADDLTAGPSVFTSTATVTSVLAFMIDLAQFWRDEYSLMAEDDNVYIGPLEYNREDKISDAVNDVLKYGYLDTLPSTAQRRRPFYIVVYENRIAKTFPEPDVRTDDPTWFVSIHSLAADSGGFSVQTSTKDVYNKIYVAYNDPNLDGSTYLSAKEDVDSQAQFGIREGVISIGESTLNVAQVVQDLVIEYNSTPKGSASFEMIGNPRTASGMVKPLHKIRAGDLIQLVDHDASTATLMGGPSGISNSIAFVAATKYSAEDHTMQLTLGSEADVLESLLIRLGVKAGGVS